MQSETQLSYPSSQALYFDVRKGAHSVGSSVRDAASYVLWSLARSQDAPTMRPYALEIARRLVAVSVYDREIHIRRAASAAFQENVGRLVRSFAIHHASQFTDRLHLNLERVPSWH